MAAKVIRRRVTDDSKDRCAGLSDSDSLKEPLLGKFDPKKSRSEQDSSDGSKQERFNWINVLSQSLVRIAGGIANIFSSFASFLRRIFSHSSVTQNMKGDKKFPIDLTPLQEERLRNLRLRLEVPYDSLRDDHQDALMQLWTVAYPNREHPSLKSDLWKEMGWQGSDPSTDFRGGGFISLENLLYFAKSYPNSFHKLLHKEDGERAEWEYPFAIAGVNISFMLTQMLGLQSGKITSRAAYHFLDLLEEDERAFDELYCVAFQMLDSVWLAKRATYMEFNEVLKSTRANLEQELSLEGISRIQDMPSHKMLSR